MINAPQQTYSVYGLRQDASNFERVTIKIALDGKSLSIASEAAGSGVAKPLRDVAWARQFIQEFFADNFIGLDEAKENRFYSETG